MRIVTEKFKYLLTHNRVETVPGSTNDTHTKCPSAGDMAGAEEKLYGGGGNTFLRGWSIWSSKWIVYA